MSSNTTKTREEILAERQEKKKRKAASKNQPKEKNKNVKKDVTGDSTGTTDSLRPSFESKNKNEGTTKNKEGNCTASEIPKLASVGKISGDIKKQEHLENKEKVQKETPESELKMKQNENTAEAGKTKAELKALRRAKQEADRARKAEKAQQGQQPQVEEKKVVKSTVKQAEPMKTSVPTKNVSDLSHKVKLFAHLYNLGTDVDFFDGSLDKVHPSIIQLGTRYSSKVVSGANACCLALLNALKKVVMDFETPQNQEFSRGLEAEITKSMAYLSKCRPVAVSMVNAVKHLKFQVSQSKGNELECKNIISEWIDTYVKEQLEMAAKAICLFVREKIAPGDVILTYGCSSLIQQILITVHNEGISFQVVVVDGRPWLEGREMLRKLVSAGIQCTYVFVNGLSFIMPEVTKILLGAHALLANGYVMSRAGSSQIALLAKTYNVPVLVCCETHKFSERVQTDSFVHNELGNPDDLASKKGCLSQELSKWKSIQCLTPLNLTYDVTPPDLVSAVVTEIAVLPCTSVPVILRIKPPDVSY